MPVRDALMWPNAAHKPQAIAAGGYGYCWPASMRLLEALSSYFLKLKYGLASEYGLINRVADFCSSISGSDQ